MRNVYQQINPDERVQWLSKVFEQQFGDGYFFVQGMIDNLMANTHCAISHDYRNLHIYEERLAQGETFSPQDLYNYANELHVHGRYEEAIECYQKYLTSRQGGIEDNIACCGKVADCFLALNNPEKHLEYIYKSFIYSTPRAESCCRLGLHYLQVNELKQAAYWYKAATELEKPADCWGMISHDCWTWLPHIQLCVCYDRLGSHELAYKHNEIAAGFVPDNPSVVYNRNYFDNLFNKST